MLNRVILMGRITADPERKQTTGGVAVTAFSIAVERNFSGKDGKRETDFINIVAWRQTAEFLCKHFAKGRMIALEGSIQVRGYQDKQGNKRTAFEVVADQVYFADSKIESKAKTAFSAGDFEEIGSDDMPF